MQIVGIDIGTNLIKGVELERKKDNFILSSFASVRSAGLNPASSQIFDQQAAIEALQNLFREGNFKTGKVSIALPESDVFSQVIKMPKMSEKELAKSLQWETQQYIPMPIEQVNYDFQVIREDAENVELMLVAAPKELVSKYVKLIQDAGLEVGSVETSMQALSRLDFFGKGRDGTDIVINIGANSSDVGFIYRGALRLTRSLPIGGTTLAKAVSEGLNIPLEQAEEYKRGYGLDDAALEGKITTALEPFLASIVKEISRSIDFYTSRSYGENVSRLVLSGGSSALPGILQYFAGKTGIETEIIDPFLNIDIPEKFAKEDFSQMRPSFALAVGLALSQS